MQPILRQLEIAIKKESCIETVFICKIFDTYGKQIPGLVIVPDTHPLYTELDKIYGTLDINLKPFRIDAIIHNNRVYTEAMLKEKDIKISQLKGKYKIILAQSSKERKQLLQTLTIKDNEKVEIKFDVRIINTHHYFNTLKEALLMYNSIK